MSLLFAVVVLIPEIWCLTHSRFTEWKLVLLSYHISPPSTKLATIPNLEVFDSLKREKENLYCTEESRPVFTGKQILLQLCCFNNSWPLSACSSVISDRIKQASSSHVFILLKWISTEQIHYCVDCTHIPIRLLIKSLHSFLREDSHKSWQPSTN